jgi:hypothetical protein
MCRQVSGASTAKQQIQEDFIMAFNQSLYNATLKTLKEHGVPQALAIQAAEIIAKDDPLKPNLGRSKYSQEIIQQAYNYLK